MNRFLYVRTCYTPLLCPRTHSMRAEDPAAIAALCTSPPKWSHARGTWPSQMATHVKHAICGSRSVVGRGDSTKHHHLVQHSSEAPHHAPRNAGTSTNSLQLCPESPPSRQAIHRAYPNQPPNHLRLLHHRRARHYTTRPSHNAQAQPMIFTNTCLPAGQARRLACGGAPLLSPPRTPWPPAPCWPHAEPSRRWRRLVARPPPPRSCP